MRRISSFFCFVILIILLPLQTQAKIGKVLKIDFKDAILEQSGNFSFASFSLASMTQGEISLLNMVRAIDCAASDPGIGMIYMTPDNISAGMSQMEEVRAALERFRSAGKMVVAYCGSLSNASYYMASVADKVILDPSSENYILGLASQQIFLKDALDALGVDVQLIRHGKYKSAGEMFTRSDFSPENYEQNRVMVNSLWNSMCEEIAGSRGFSSDDFKGWINDLALVDNESFKEKGLVDELWHLDQVNDYFCQLSGVNSVKQVNFVSLSKYVEKLDKSQKKKGKEKKSGLFALLRKLVSKNKPATNSTASDGIAIVYVNGEIMASADQLGTSSEVVVGKTLAQTLSKVRTDDAIKAVVFRVNSPGGSVMASEVIKREMDLLKGVKPVIASYGDYAASGGYWISAGADRIFTDKLTLTGSIGCFSMVPNIGGAIKSKLHVNIATVGSSEHSDMMSGMRGLDDAEVGYLQCQIEDIYDRFTTIVSDGRGMSKDSVDEIGQGRVWTGSDALAIGLADQIGGLSDAIIYAAQCAEIKSYHIVEYPEVKPFSLLSLFGEESDPDETVTSDNDDGLYILLQKKFPFASALRGTSAPVTMARLPMDITFN